ncbi:MAG: ACP phosphodiesterase [Bacteroidales bacterium]
MNFLAHILLAGKQTELQIGGFIADYVKGSQFTDFSPAIAEGIILHRKIDAFTDSHPIVHQMRKYLRPHFGRYAGVFLDVFFDYCLANNWRKFHSDTLLKFTYKFYYKLWKNHHQLPSQIQGIFWHFTLSNRLYQYKYIKGVERALWIMGNYTSLPQMSKESAVFLRENQNVLEQNFLTFFPLVISFANDNVPHLD